MFAFVFLTMFFQLKSNAQTYQGGFACASQSEVEAAVQILLDGGYTAISGSLFIASADDNNPAIITDLSGFSMLERVGELQIINTDSLTSLYGLHNLDTISNVVIFIEDNQALVSTAGLNGAIFHNLNNSIDSYVAIRNNPKLENLNGLEGITHVSGQLRINNNPMLSDISGLSNLHTAGDLDNGGGLFTLSEFAGQDISPLNNLKIAASFSLRNCPSLINIDVLSNLDTVGRLALSDLPELIDISPFDSLVIINSEGNLWLYNCPRIQTIPNLIFENNRMTRIQLIDMEGLSDISVIEDLTTIFRLEVNNCASLASLNTSNWEGGLLELVENELITSIDISNFSEPDHSQGIRLEIKNNPLLQEVVGSNDFTSASEILIENNESLNQIIGFNGLEEVVKVIIDNPNLELVSGFKSVRTIGEQFANGGLIISGNLIELNAFDNLVEVIEDDLSIGALGLEHVPPFDSLQRVGGRVGIGGSNLIEYNGFHNLQFAGIMSFGNNPYLESLNIANNLDSLYWGFTCARNPILAEISGFNNFNYWHDDDEPVFKLFENPSLESIPGLCNVINVMEEWPTTSWGLDIYDNAEGFNSTEEIENYCEELTPIEDPTSFLDLKVFPNPTLGLVTIDHIDANKIYSIALYDALGREVLNLIPTSEQHVLDLSLYSDGLYWIALLDKKGTVVGRSSIVKLE